MTSFENGILSLDSANDAYYAGHTLKGKYEFTIQQPTIIRGLYAKFSGYARVSWSDTESKEVNVSSKDFKVEYEGEEQYIDTIQYLVGNNFGELTLAPGSYSYDFQCYLPPNLPSTFDYDESGYVEYSVTIHVVTPSEIKEACNVTFNVIAPLDLNMHPRSKDPIHLQLEEMYSCCLCGSGPLTVDIKLPYTGYCPGQKMPIELTCENKSNIEIQKVNFFLNKQVTLHSQQPKSDYEFPSDVVSDVSRGPVPCDATRRWTVDLDVPSLDPSNLLNCKLIDIFYKLEVEVVLGGCNDNLTDDTDIIIGTIPIVGFQDDVEDPLKDRLPSVPPPPQQPIIPAIPSPTNIPYPISPLTVPYNPPSEINSYPPSAVETQNSYPMTQIPNSQPLYPPYPMPSNTSGYPPPYPTTKPSNLPYPTTPLFSPGVMPSTGTGSASGGWGTLPTASAPSAPPPDSEGNHTITPGVGFPYPATSQQ